MFVPFLSGMGTWTYSIFTLMLMRASLPVVKGEDAAAPGIDVEDLIAFLESCGT